MTPLGYIGIDFGTSNSHFAYCNTEGDLRPQPIALRARHRWRPACYGGFPPKRKAISWPTAMRRSKPDAIRCRATSRWPAWFQAQVATSDERGATPGISPRACEEIERSGLPRKTCPAAWPSSSECPGNRADHKRLTAEVARDAGFVSSRCMEEPFGRWPSIQPGDITPANRCPGRGGRRFWRRNARRGPGKFGRRVRAVGGPHSWRPPLDDLLPEWLADRIVRWKSMTAKRWSSGKRNAAS